MQSRRYGTYREYVEAVQTLAWLEATWFDQYAKETNEVIQWPATLQDLWAFSGSIICEKQFESVVCPACHKTYTPADVQVCEWSYGQDLALAGYGGEGVVCPSGHGLYVILTWQS